MKDRLKIELKKFPMKNPKKILMLNYEFPPLGGGGGVASKQLAKGFIKNGYQVDLITGWMKGLKRFEKVDEINVYRVQTFGREGRATASNLYMATYLAFGFFKGVQLCLKNKYQFINTQFVLPTGPLGFVLGKIFKLKNIISIYGGDIYDPSLERSPHNNRFLKKLINFLFKNSHSVVAESTDIKNNADKYYDFSREIEVIPISYEKFVFKKNSRKRLNLEGDKIYLISVGRMVERKGFKFLVSALKNLPENVYSVIIGEGPEKENLLKLAQKLKVEERLILPGFVSEKKKFQYLDNADIYVLSSLHEGFGIVLQEAMQVGLPIVATNKGGQVDFVKEGKNGFLVKPENSKLLAQKIKELIENKKLRKEMSDLNKKDINNYKMEKIALKYLDLLESDKNFFKKNQKDTYKNLASKFDQIQKRENRNHYNKIKAILNYLKISNRDKVLEIGVGTGIHMEYVLRELKTKRFSLHGVDYSQEMLDISKEKVKNFKNVFLECMDGERLDFSDNYFDKVFISGSLHHYQDPKKGISEIFRVLKKGGKFCIMEPNYIFPTNVYAWNFKKEEYNMRHMKKNNFEKWLKSSGIKNFEINNFAYTPPFPEKLIPAYDLIDEILQRIPFVSNFSVMLFVTGKK